MVLLGRDYIQLYCKCVLCDLDGTLVETDNANFLAYKEAIEEVMGVSIVSKKGRFTKENIRDVCPQISDDELKTVVKCKNDVFEKYLCETTPKFDVVALVEKMSERCQVILCSNSNSRRGNDVLAYHNLDRLFNKKYYNILPLNKNKYIKVLSLYNITSKDVLVIENDEADIIDAINAGILTEQIIDVRWKF